MDEVFIIDFKINKKHYYCLWYSSEQDLFITDNKKIVYSNNKSKLINDYIGKYTIGENVTIIDVDEILKNLNSNPIIDCDLIINFWNMLSDLSKTLKIEFYGNKRTSLIDNIYNKMFYALNLPSLNDTSEKFEPKWKEKEIIVVHNLIKSGVEILKNSLNITDF